jgi:very-short-patch-repair endonuclease
MLNYIVDFYCHEIMLAIEIDGDSHLHKYEYDKKREGELEQMGVKFIRFNDIDVKKNMFSVTLSLEQTVSVILKESNTPLWSPQGDNPSDRQLK